jgi:hypothetical protein
MTTSDVAKRTTWNTPPNLGWLECNLSDEEINHLWKCVKGSSQCVKKELAGNISHSYDLNDLNDYFFNNTITPLIEIYKTFFIDLINHEMPVLDKHLYEPKLQKFWVNYQKQHDFNPIHDHSGIYSFVIWLKIPIEFEDQNKNNITNTPVKSAFAFEYNTILGNPNSHVFKLGKEYEGKLLFFPAKLAHQVYPFFDCVEDRISISGNILMKRKDVF